MQSEYADYKPRKNKKLLIAALLIVATLINISGLFYSIYSSMNNISFKVLNNNVPGSIFGLLVLYLGIRYFLSVLKLRKELYKPTSNFSWNNFKTHKIKI